MKNIFSLFAFLFIATSLSASATSEEEALTQMLNKFLAGASVNDAAAHERFWDDDLVYTSSSGLRFGKNKILEGLSSNAESAAQDPPIVFSAEDIRIRQYGGTAVVAFRLVGTLPNNPTEVMEYFNTGTFVKHDGEWRVVAWQATIIPKEE